MEQWQDIFFTDTAKLEKLYRSCVQQAAKSYRLTPNEIVVLMFLGRNTPRQDTATDIASTRGISKALVARSVDRLHRRGFLECERDANDRRVVHLRLCGEGVAVAGQLRRNGLRIASQLRDGVTEEEMQAVHGIIKKMQGNMDALLEQMERQVK